MALGSAKKVGHSWVDFHQDKRLASRNIKSQAPVPIWPCKFNIPICYLRLVCKLIPDLSQVVENGVQWARGSVADLGLLRPDWLSVEADAAGAGVGRVAPGDCIPCSQLMRSLWWLSREPPGGRFSCLGRAACMGPAPNPFLQVFDEVEFNRLSSIILSTPFDMRPFHMARVAISTNPYLKKECCKFTRVGRKMSSWHLGCDNCPDQNGHSCKTWHRSLDSSGSAARVRCLSWQINQVEAPSANDFLPCLSRAGFCAGQSLRTFLFSFFVFSSLGDPYDLWRH